jgi:hypothetical protein
MDRRLTTEEVTVMRAMREVNAGVIKVPAHLAPKLRMLGYVAVHGSGQYALTLKGRDELIDRDRDAARMN